MYLLLVCATQNPIVVHPQLGLVSDFVCVESEAMSPARPDDQSCFEHGLRVVGEKDPDSTSHGANRIHSRSRRASGKDDERGSSDIEMCKWNLRNIQ